MYFDVFYCKISLYHGIANQPAMFTVNDDLLTAKHQAMLRNSGFF